jgi:hypothetical protein
MRLMIMIVMPEKTVPAKTPTVPNRTCRRVPPVSALLPQLIPSQWRERPASEFRERGNCH